MTATYHMRACISVRGSCVFLNHAWLARRRYVQPKPAKGPGTVLVRIRLIAPPPAAEGAPPPLQPIEAALKLEGLAAGKEFGEFKLGSGATPRLISRAQRMNEGAARLQAGPPCLDTWPSPAADSRRVFFFDLSGLVAHAFCAMPAILRCIGVNLVCDLAPLQSSAGGKAEPMPPPPN
eukprot:COSAG05_NODE_29_length_29038_cov_1237.466985_31_plen_178_part_00